jgi:hypothetical protein
MRDGARKKPIRHRVESHLRNRKRVHSYTRGNGTVEVKPEPKIIREHPKPELKPHREFYTQNGWEGKKYQETKNLPLKEIAKRVKKEVLAKHPYINISVKTDHFSGGSSLDVHITAYPKQFLEKKLLYTEMSHLPEDKIPKYAWVASEDENAKALLKDIEHIVNQYRYDDSDSMIDYFSNNFYSSVLFDHDLRKIELKRLGMVD